MKTGILFGLIPLALATTLCSCSTLSNRRDLYSCKPHSGRCYQSLVNDDALLYDRARWERVFGETWNPDQYPGVERVYNEPCY